jgi:hypothetical protein
MTAIFLPQGLEGRVAAVNLHAVAPMSPSTVRVRVPRNMATLPVRTIEDAERARARSGATLFRIGDLDDVTGATSMILARKMSTC